MAVRTDDGENAVTIRCSYCNKKLIESIEGQFVGVIKCKCGTINNLEGRAGVVTVRGIEGRRGFGNARAFMLTGRNRTN